MIRIIYSEPQDNSSCMMQPFKLSKNYSTTGSPDTTTVALTPTFHNVWTVFNFFTSNNHYLIIDWEVCWKQCTKVNNIIYAQRSTVSYSCPKIDCSWHKLELWHEFILIFLLLNYRLISTNTSSVGLQQPVHQFRLYLVPFITSILTCPLMIILSLLHIIVGSIAHNCWMLPAYLLIDCVNEWMNE